MRREEELLLEKVAAAANLLPEDQWLYLIGFAEGVIAASDHEKGNRVDDERKESG